MYPGDLRPIKELVLVDRVGGLLSLFIKLAELGLELGPFITTEDFGLCIRKRILAWYPGSEITDILFSIDFDSSIETLSSSFLASGLVTLSFDVEFSCITCVPIIIDRIFNHSG